MLLRSTPSCLVALGCLRSSSPPLRHALEHLFRGHDSFAERLARCVTPGEAYHISGLGPGFWSRIAELIDSETPLWCPAVECGLQLLGLLAPCLSDFRTRIAHVLEGYRSIRERSPDLTFPEITDFLERVSRLQGRTAPQRGNSMCTCMGGWSRGDSSGDSRVRTRLPLRQRLREAPSESVEALGRFPAMVSTYQYEAAFETFRSFRTDSFWESILPELDEAYSTALPFAERAHLWCEIVAVMRERFHVHPLEIVDVVIELGDRTKASSCGEFKGFCRDTFAFLKELSEANSAEWMAANREPLSVLRSHADSGALPSRRGALYPPGCESRVWLGSGMRRQARPCSSPVSARTITGVPVHTSRCSG